MIASPLLGLAAAFAASALYAFGIALQALEARRAPRERALRLSLFRELVGRRRWIAGTALGLVGWAAQSAALLAAPLTLVQPSLAAGLIVLLAIGTRTLGEPVGRREIAAVVAIAAGVAGLGWAVPTRDPRHAVDLGLVLALVALGAAALLPYVLARARRSPGLAVAAAAGVAYAWDGLATKFFSDDLSALSWLGMAFWFLAMNVAAGVGTLSEMSALQTRPATQVAPVVLVLNTLVPVGLAPVLAGESWGSSPIATTTLVVSLAAVLAGAILLARSRAVGTLLSSEATDTARKCEAASRAASRSTVASAEAVEPIETVTRSPA